MADEQIAIEITDKVASSIPQKIDRIAASSRDAHTAVMSLQQAINSLSSGRVDRVTSDAAAATTRLQQAQTNAATATQRLQTELQRTATQTQRLGTESQKTATQAQRLATEAQRTASATAAAAAAQDRAALAALRLQQAQDRAAAATQRSTSAFEQFAMRALSVAGVTLATTALLRYADAYTTLQNKLQNVTTSQGQVVELTERLYQVANDTRTGIEATSTAFARFDRALKFMGKSQEDTLRMTETINKGLVVSGATAQEAASALLQLSQAFNAGKLQGDEFRSISENMPMILDATAKAMGVTIDQVKKMSTEGKITSKVMFDALKILETQVDATFAKTAPTISQALTNLNTNVGKFVGEADRAVGLSAALASGILFLSKNVELLTLASVGVGAALLVAFGPQLATALATATRGAAAFSAALSANPVGIIVAAVALAVTALTLFSDQIKVSSDGVVTLRDVCAATFAYIRIGFEAMTKVVGAIWDALMGWLSQGMDTFGGFIGGMLSRIFQMWKTSVNGTIALAVNAVDLVTTAWEKFPKVMSAIFSKIYNYGVDQIEALVNSWVSGLQAIVQAASGIAPEMAKSLGDSLENLKVKFDRSEINAEGASAGAELAARMSERFRTDYIGNAGDAIMEGARKLAEARKAGDSLLRGAGKSELGDGGDSAAAEKRATALAKINAQLDSQLSNMFKLAPQRAIDSKMDEIEIQLLSRKIKLTGEEAASIRDKITQVEKAKLVQQEYDALYQQVSGPQQTYNNQLKAADALLTAGAISAERHAGALARAKDVYSAAVDPMYAVTKATREQLDVLSMQGPAMERERQLIEWRNKAMSDGIIVTESQTAAFMAQAQAVQIATSANDAYARATGNQAQSQQDLLAVQSAIGQVMNDGSLRTDQQTLALQRLNVEAANLRITMGDGSFMDGVTSSMGNFVSGFNGIVSGLGKAWGDMCVGMVDGFANSVGKAIVYGGDFKTMMSDLSKQVLSEMISALVRMGVQYTLNQALGVASAEAVGAAQVASTTAATAASVAGTATVTATSTAAAATTAAAWTPAAIWASIGSFGQAAVMAGGAILAVKALGGFKTGGYTGGGGVSDVAGLVHGQEFVMNAEATRRIGVGNLQAMQDGNYDRIQQVVGNSSVGSSSYSNGPSVSFTVINNVEGAKVTTQESKDDEGNVDVVMTLDTIEQGLAARVNSGRGPLTRSISSAFGMRPKPNGG